VAPIAPTPPPQTQLGGGGEWGRPTVQQTQWAQPAASAAPAAGVEYAYKIRHRPTGRFLAEGLDPKNHGTPKLWAKHSHAKTAVTMAISRKLAAEGEYEIVSVPMQGS
jgi:hypothetical protein